jgi:hypothetical protein
MSRGGARPGAGRKPGSKLTKTAAIAHKLAEEGVTPLEYVLTLMRDESQPAELRLECAKTAMPYIHPRIQVQSITQNNMQVNNYGSDGLKKVLEQVEQIHALGMKQVLSL